MIKAVFLDFDYTLYSHKTKCIPPSAVRAVAKLKERGIKVFLATGRDTAEMSIFPEYLDLHLDGYIMLNGQLCLDSDFRKVFGNPFAQKPLKALVDLFNSKTQPLVFVEENDHYINFQSPVVEKANGEIACLTHPVKEYSGNPVYLAVAYITKEEEKDLLAKLPGCCLKRWGEGGVDIVSEGSDKAKVIDKVLGIYGFGKDEYMVVGDSYNDIDMVRSAPVGVAMGNSVQELKEVADFVTTDIDDNGLENALKFFNLI